MKVYLLLQLAATAIFVHGNHALSSESSFPSLRGYSYSSAAESVSDSLIHL